MIRLEKLTYRPAGVTLLEGFSAAFAPGSIVSFVGRSGCGKSTLLRLIAGLRPLDGGEIHGVPAQKAFVFQDPALLPWLDARANAALPGRYGAMGDVDEALAAVGLTPVAHQLPASLSGGQRMRVSLARALVSRPSLVLLDEAFAALDGITRRSVQATFLALAAEYRWTVLLVTHELEDAVRLSDRVIALEGPPLRIVDDVRIFLPRPSGHADATIVARLDKALASSIG